MRDAHMLFALSLATVVLTVIAFVTIPEVLIGVFLSPDDPQRAEIIAIGVLLLLVAALFQLVDALQVISLGILRGLHDTRAPMIIAGLSYWGLGLPAAYVLGFPAGFGFVGVWFGLVFGLGMAAILLMHRFFTREGTGPAARLA